MYCFTTKILDYNEYKFDACSYMNKSVMYGQEMICFLMLIIVYSKLNAECMCQKLYDERPAYLVLNTVNISFARSFDLVYDARQERHIMPQ